MQTLIVIPARLNSTRLPRKLLLAETGKPLVAETWHRCRETTRWDGPVVATDSVEIAHQCGKENIACHATREHPNGTSRAAEIAERETNFDAYCIVQADYPEIPPTLIDKVIDELERHPEWDCATAACGESEEFTYHDLQSKNRVKVVVQDGVAIDFGRNAGLLYDKYNHLDKAIAGVHVGIYCYRRASLLRYAAAGPCEREQAESLEQLRALHIGMKIGVILWPKPVHGIDTRDDYDSFIGRWRAKNADPATVAT